MRRTALPFALPSRPRSSHRHVPAHLPAHPTPGSVKARLVRVRRGAASCVCACVCACVRLQMSQNSFLARDVDLEHLAEVTKNFSGAEIEGLVKDAAAYALNRQIDFNDLNKPLDEEAIKVGADWAREGCRGSPVAGPPRRGGSAVVPRAALVGAARTGRPPAHPARTHRPHRHPVSRWLAVDAWRLSRWLAQVTMADFEHALEEVKPAFGAATETLELYRVHGMISCGDQFDHITHTLHTLVQQVQNSDKTPLLTCLLEGPAGSGKSAMAATAALDSEFPFVKVISPESLIGYNEQVRSFRGMALPLLLTEYVCGAAQPCVVRGASAVKRLAALWTGGLARWQSMC